MTRREVILTGLIVILGFFGGWQWSSASFWKVQVEICQGGAQ